MTNRGSALSSSKAAFSAAFILGIRGYLIGLCAVLTIVGGFYAPKEALAFNYAYRQGCSGYSTVDEGQIMACYDCGTFISCYNIKFW